MLCLEFLFDILLLEKQNILISIYYRSLKNEYHTSTLAGRRTIGSFLWKQEVGTEPTTTSKSHHIYWFFNKYSLQVTYVAMPFDWFWKKKWFWWYLIQSKSCIAGLRKFHMLHVRCWILGWTELTVVYLSTHAWQVKWYSWQFFCSAYESKDATEWGRYHWRNGTHISLGYGFIHL
jgi:hypothetical protein